MRPRFVSSRRLGELARKGAGRVGTRIRNTAARTSMALRQAWLQGGAGRLRLGLFIALSSMLVLAAALGGLASVQSWSALQFTHISHAPTQTIANSTATSGGEVSIADENSEPGTEEWAIAETQAATTQIQAYASALSVSSDQTLTFFVSTQKPSTPYDIAVYRLGWYGGAGGRLVWLSAHRRGQAQGYYDWARRVLIGCSTCTHDPSTGLVEANWLPSFSLTIPPSWVTGLYVAKLTDADGWQTEVSFVVRGHLTSTYVAVVPDTTTAAYNPWGGYSLYRGPDNTYASRATKVSFNRPAPGWRFGFGQGLPYLIDAIRWLERRGYDVSYLSSVDLHEDPTQLLRHRAYLSLGHDEYWSWEMRDGVERARDAGIGLAFFGANAVYFQIRFEADGAGARDRRIVCYKGDPRRDPLFGKDNMRVTTIWRGFPVLRPENELIGIMYSGFDSVPRGFPWQFSPSATTSASPLLAGTNLQPGRSYGCDVVGYEWDRVFDYGHTPANLHVLSTSHTVSVGYGPDSSNSTYYVAPSGALVFASGSIYWSYALDDLRVPDVTPEVSQVQKVDTQVTCSATGGSKAVPELQALMANVMQALIVRQTADL